MELPNPPSERVWTDEEKESFFASQDAMTGLLSGAVASNARPNSDSWLNLSITSRGIHVTSIVPPEQGWPIAAHCNLCQKTEIVLSVYAMKPKDGDYFRLNRICLDEELHMKHNMFPQRETYPWEKK